MGNKRKRDELNDSDTDEITPGRQILPVANLPHNFDQEPEDGLQYLFLVRRDARRLPHVTRARNPYEVSETKVAPTSTSSSIDDLPCEEWRIAFQKHFSNLRKNLTQATVHTGYVHSRVVPEKKDRDAWWKFLTGHPESAWSATARSARGKPSTSCRARASVDSTEAVLLLDTTSTAQVQPVDESSGLSISRTTGFPRDALRWPSTTDARSAVSTSAVSLTTGFPALPEKEHTGQLSPPEVTPGHLTEIDHRMSIHLLMYFTHWINIHLENPGDPLTTISVSHGRWIFALLTKIEDRLSADEMNLLRNLARACLGLIQRYKTGQPKDINAMITGASVPSENANMSDASCWMVFTAVAGHWGQRDLWADAEAGLGCT